MNTTVKYAITNTIPKTLIPWTLEPRENPWDPVEDEDHQLEPSLEQTIIEFGEHVEIFGFNGKLRPAGNEDYRNLIAVLPFKTEQIEALVFAISAAFRSKKSKANVWKNLLDLTIKNAESHTVVMIIEEWMSEVFPLVADLTETKSNTRGVVLEGSSFRATWIFAPTNYTKRERLLEKQTHAFKKDLRDCIHNTPFFVKEMKPVKQASFYLLLEIYAAAYFDVPLDGLERVINALNDGEITYTNADEFTRRAYELYIAQPSVDTATNLHSIILQNKSAIQNSTMLSLRYEGLYWGEELKHYKKSLTTWEAVSAFGPFVLAFFAVLAVESSIEIKNLSPVSKTILLALIPITTLQLFLKVRYIRRLIGMSYSLRMKLNIWALSFDLNSEKQNYFKETYKDMLTGDLATHANDEILTELTKKIGEALPKSADKGKGS